MPADHSVSVLPAGHRVSESQSGPKATGRFQKLKKIFSRTKRPSSFVSDTTASGSGSVLSPGHGDSESQLIQDPGPSQFQKVKKFFSPKERQSRMPTVPSEVGDNVATGSKPVLKLSQHADPRVLMPVGGDPRFVTDHPPPRPPRREAANSQRSTISTVASTETQRRQLETQRRQLMNLDEPNLSTQSLPN